MRVVGFQGLPLRLGFGHGALLFAKSKIHSASSGKTSPFLLHSNVSRASFANKANPIRPLGSYSGNLLHSTRHIFSPVKRLPGAMDLHPFCFTSFTVIFAVRQSFRRFGALPRPHMGSSDFKFEVLKRQEGGQLYVSVAMTPAGECATLPPNERFVEAPELLTLTC